MDRLRSGRGEPAGTPRGISGPANEIQGIFADLFAALGITAHRTSIFAGGVSGGIREGVDKLSTPAVLVAAVPSFGTEFFLDGLAARRPKECDAVSEHRILALRAC
ncbi:hypothetical protein BOSEA31B_11473 [Hyphomicrobiales bacterium]|nr:hypothetical protein BOSEA31B_11473 [Hyphomicrobiales bacterium]CAH1697269.1 hypothetical protein BOSEA1005_10306 [Hyphomicrobiales bacterium]CAI0342836.1 hypothetical protein BO1005MUT1_10129 [Hyphomicrobiales bacterium]